MQDFLIFEKVSEKAGPYITAKKMNSYIRIKLLDQVLS